MPRLRPAPESDPKKVDEKPVEAPDVEQVEVVAASDEPAIEVVEEPSKPDEASLALQKQLDDLKKSEELAARYRQEAEEARRSAAEAEKRLMEQQVESRKSQEEAVQSQYDAISSALAAATAAVASAKRDIRAAISSGDADEQTEAHDRLAIARDNVKELENGKYALEARFKAEKTESPKPQVQQARQPATVDELVDSWNLPATENRWCKDHADYITDPDKRLNLTYVSQRLERKGMKPGNPNFIAELEGGLAQLEDRPSQPQQREQRTSIVSAPVSREVPSSNGQKQDGKVTLTAVQREAAKISGISEVEYAKQMLKLNRMKANGEYGGEQR